MKKLWRNFKIFLARIGDKRTKRRSIKKYPNAYREQGWEFEDWGER